MGRKFTCTLIEKNGHKLGKLLIQDARLKLLTYLLDLPIFVKPKLTLQFFKKKKEGEKNQGNMLNKDINS